MTFLVTTPTSYSTISFTRSLLDTNTMCEVWLTFSAYCLASFVKSEEVMNAPYIAF